MNCNDWSIYSIVAIHGLNGHRDTSGTATNKKMWLEDFLPDDIPNARIFTYGYDAAISGQPQLAKATMFDHAQQLINKVVDERKVTKTSEPPIIFIAHSMGGIVLKFVSAFTSHRLPGYDERPRYRP
ncbi:hypothetical protein BU17DRAFT_52984 [Hysterangium stoloniferum]|nr:hypothetical protein BU17DRAFT_52984 [Hysterangium stoloniferum]